MATVNIVEQKVEVPPPRFMLELSQEEAASLLLLCGQIRTFEGTIGRYAADIFFSLAVYEKKIFNKNSSEIADKVFISKIIDINHIPLFQFLVK